LFEKIFNFIKTLLFGKFLMNFLDWFANPANKGKIQSFVRFIKDWWPALTAAVLLFGTGFTSLAAGLVKIIAGFTVKLVALIPKLMAALAKLKLGKLLKMIPGAGILKGGLILGGGVLATYGIGKMLNKDKVGENLAEEELTKTNALVEGGMNPGEAKVLADSTRLRDAGGGGSVNNMRTSTDMLQLRNDPLGGGFSKFNKGGQVPGSGNTDTVPAMLTPGEFVMSKGAVQQYGVDTLAGMNAAAGGTNRPTMGGYSQGGKVTMSQQLGHTRGTVTDPKEKKAQEDYMLHWVNKERVEILGLPPLKSLTYADGVELTKKMGPGPKTTETSDTDMNFDTGMKSTWKTKSRGGETIFQGSSEMITQEDRDKFFAANPHARMMLDLKDQAELDALGADISASAKMNGGGLVQGFQGGGSVGRVKFTGEQLKKLVKNGSTKKIPTITPPSTKPKVTVVNQPGTEEVDASQAQLPAGGNREIPPFDATVIRSSHKMEVLGISI